MPSDAGQATSWPGRRHFVRRADPACRICSTWKHQPVVLKLTQIKVNKAREAVRLSASALSTPRADTRIAPAGISQLAEGPPCCSLQQVPTGTKLLPSSPRFPLGFCTSSRRVVFRLRPQVVSCARLTRQRAALPAAWPFPHGSAPHPSLPRPSARARARLDHGHLSPTSEDFNWGVQITAALGQAKGKPFYLWGQKDQACSAWILQWKEVLSSSCTAQCCYADIWYTCVFFLLICEKNVLHSGKRYDDPGSLDLPPWSQRLPRYLYSWSATKGRTKFTSAHCRN